jgi:O-acetyl-ADP-ribose deacetylase (regulator of RNase III)
VETVVNTVSAESIMGKGIALQFRKAYPKNYEAYRRACKVGEVQPGRMFVFDRHTLTSPRYIINFPTKRRWRHKSRMEDIKAGLVALVAEVRRLGIQSIAVPPLGSGLGGLPQPEVRRRIWQHLRSLVRQEMLRPSQWAAVCTSDAIWSALTAGAVGGK